VTRCFIALGSNLNEPARQLRQALDALESLNHTRLLRASSAYRSAAVGPGSQPDYLNAVSELETRLAPEALLDALQQQELAQGRTRNIHWGPRTLDLDILLYGELQIQSPRLTIPHPQMKQRDFVLHPLLELCGANFVLPGGEELGTLVDQCPTGRLNRTALTLHSNGPE
jgi:2-amino-4-hydroxy-6-hydroxymethyldihydropteridine diphosphokinase